jgi:integrase
MKSEASRKPVPLEADLAEVLMAWRAECAYNQPDDYIFASIEMDGKQPLWPNSAMEDHIRPEAIRAGIIKRIGWHTLRHTFGTLLSEWGRCGDRASSHATCERQRHNGQVHPSGDPGETQSATRHFEYVGRVAKLSY